MNFEFPDWSRRGDDLERFMLFVEHFEAATELVDSGTVARQRMGLVAFDTLAEGLLFRNLQERFLASDEGMRQTPRRYSARERRAARDVFSKRVALAMEEIDGLMSFRYPGPVLDRADGAIFRLGHYYRNPVYHEDRHNPALLESVARLYGAALGRAFVRSQQTSYGSYYSKERVAKLEALGWQPDEHGTFWPRLAAEAVMVTLCRGLDVSSDELRESLAEDVAYRCDEVDGQLEELVRDLGEEKTRRFLEDVQDWAAHRGDETWLALQQEHDELETRAMKEGFGDEVNAALRAVEAKQFQYLFGSERPRASRVNMASSGRLRYRGDRLRGFIGSLPDLLERYRAIDHELELLENAVYYMTVEWDREVQMAIDIARGK